MNDLTERKHKLLQELCMLTFYEKEGRLSQVLETITRHLEAAGCILWHATPWTVERKEQKDASVPPPGRLFTVASWFEGTEENAFLALHITELHESGSYKAIRSGDPCYGSSIYEQSLRDRGIQHYMAFPIPEPWTRDGEINEGKQMFHGAALTIYRRRDQPKFEAGDEGEIFESLMPLFQGIYASIRENKNLNLLHRVDDALTKADQRWAKAPTSDKKAAVAKRAIQEICRALDVHLHTKETSCFLRPLDTSVKNPAQWMLQTTTLKAGRKGIKHLSYSSNFMPGLTGWTLRNRKPITIPDLTRFQEDRPELEKVYGQLTWENSIGLKEKKKDELPNSPPESFIAVPILSGENLLGVLRCTASSLAPHYYSQPEIEVAEFVARRIAQAWQNWSQSLRVDVENQIWGEFSRKVEDLNHAVAAELNTAEPDMAVIYEETIQLCSEVLPGTKLNDIRRINEENQLEVAYEAPDARLANKKKLLKFDVSEGAEEVSLGQEAIRTRQTIVANDVQSHDKYQHMFPGVKHMLVAPLLLEDKIFGVLDLRSATDRPFEPYQATIASLLGKQLALYIYLHDTVGEIRRARKQEEKDTKERDRMISDLQHQLRGNHEKLINVVRKVTDRKPFFAGGIDLYRIRSLARKSVRVTRNLKILQKMERGEPLNLPLEPLDGHRLQNLLVDVGERYRSFRK